MYLVPTDIDYSLHDFHLVFSISSNSYSQSHCCLHERVFHFLQQPIDTNQSTEDYITCLHQALIDGYSHRCQQKWSTHPDDGYFYQNLIYHLQQAKDPKILIDILHDFNWLIRKITLNGVNSQEFLNMLDFCFTQKQMKVYQFFLAIMTL